MNYIKPPVKMVANEPSRQVDDDWFVLLDVAPKSAGICVDFVLRWNQIEMEMLKTEGHLCIFFISNHGTTCPSHRTTRERVFTQRAEITTENHGRD